MLQEVFKSYLMIISQLQLLFAFIKDKCFRYRESNNSVLHNINDGNVLTHGNGVDASSNGADNSQCKQHY